MARKKLIDLNKNKARDFFMESGSYFNFDLPEYFNFKKFLKQINNYKNNFDISKAKNDVTSYSTYNNKDGKYAWRKIDIIHPVAYLMLVEVITSNWKFIKKHFSDNTVSKIYSCPIYRREIRHKKHKKTQILSYLENVEKKSIEKSLRFRYMSKLDIADCYPSVYTHSISWALHSKNIAKNDRRNSFQKSRKKNQPILFGNDIDFIIQAMQGGQTNGIPQGSVLMDFVIEIILVHIDRLLYERLENEKITGYEIIRYRDDYRIFTKEKNDNENIIKILSEILIDFNFKLNVNKTEIGEDIVLMSIKKDKLENIIYYVGTDEEIDFFRLKRFLLDVLRISKSYPNSGFILRVLQHFNERGFYEKDPKWYKEDSKLLITILLEIAVNNPRCFAVICVSVFNLLNKLKKIEQKIFSSIIYNKLSTINNVGYNEVWLQRSLCKIDKTKNYQDRICHVVDGTENKSIFGNHFISDRQLRKILDKNNFINRKKLSKMSKIPKAQEVNVFSIYD